MSLPNMHRRGKVAGCKTSQSAAAGTQGWNLGSSAPRHPMPCCTSLLRACPLPQASMVYHGGSSGPALPCQQTPVWYRTTAHMVPHCTLQDPRVVPHYSRPPDLPSPV